MGSVMNKLMADIGIFAGVYVLGWLTGPYAHRLVRWGLQQIESWVGGVVKKD